MNVPGVTVIPSVIHTATGSNFSLPGGDDFSGKLQLGQIIKGRVLRQYEGSRYGVEFNGHEKIVDSAVPLKTGELLYGKVVGLGERVELERVRNMPGNTPEPSIQAGKEAILERGWTRSDRAANLVADLFEQHQLKLAPEQAALIEQSVRAAADTRLMAMSGILLSKLGIALTPEWLKLVYETLRRDARQGLFELSGKPIALEVQADAGSKNHDAASQAPVAEIAQLLKQLVEDWHHEQTDEAGVSDKPVAFTLSEDSSNAALSEQEQGQQDLANQDPARWLMNVQTGGSVGHRVNTIPLLVNDRLLELNIAVFDQGSNQGSAQEGLRHRQLSFSLNSDILGKVEAHLVLTGEHIKMSLASDREKTVEQLASYSVDLRRQLQDEGWLVDQLQYEIASASQNQVAQAVLQHIVSQGSLSLLV